MERALGARAAYEPENVRSMLLDAGFAEATVNDSSGQELVVAVVR